MGPALMATGVFCGRPLPLHRTFNTPRKALQASIKEHEPIEDRVNTSRNSSTDAKDLLSDLQRLRKQRARLRAELTSKEQKLKAKGAEDAPLPEPSVDTHVDDQIDSGNVADARAQVSHKYHYKCNIIFRDSSEHTLLR